MKTPLILTFLSFVSSVFGQNFYSFSHSTGTYTELTNPTLLSPANEVWDDPEYFVEIPFDFYYYGELLEELHGTPGLGLELFSNNDFVGNTQVIVPIYADPIDLGNLTSTPSSSISYQVEGITGARTLKIQWDNCSFYESEDQSEIFNLQLWLREGSNRIEIHFGPSNIVNAQNVFYNSGPNIWLIHNYNDGSGTISNSVVLAGEVDDPDFIIENNLDNLEGHHMNSMPNDGQIYIFTPAEAPVSLEEQQISISIELYPNPTNSLLNLRIQDGKTVDKLEILDITGRVVLTYENLQNGIDVSTLETGNYLVRVYAEDQISTAAFVKE